MKRQLLFLCFVLLLSTGCAGHHFTTENRDSVSLFLRHPDAIRVQFASSIDTFKLHDTRKNGFGFWKISLPPTDECSYFYVIDGSVYIPDCRFKETDDFGAENCIYHR